MTENVIEIVRPTSNNHPGIGTNMNIKIQIMPTAKATSPRIKGAIAPKGEAVVAAGVVAASGMNEPDVIPAKAGIRGNKKTRPDGLVLY